MKYLPLWLCSYDVVVVVKDAVSARWPCCDETSKSMPVFSVKNVAAFASHACLLCPEFTSINVHHFR